MSYAAYWERPDWVYDQVQKVEDELKSPHMMALKSRSMALFQQAMAAKFPEFFQHYTKIFFRAINGKLNKPLLLMLLKQRDKMDKGEIAWQEGNQEVIGASFNLLLRKLPEDTQQKILDTYKDLVDEEKEEFHQAVKESIEKQGGNVEQVVSQYHTQQVEVVENE